MPHATIRGNSETRHIGYGVLELTLKPDAYEWRFVGVPGTTYADAGSAPVHGPPPADTQRPDTPSGLTAHRRQQHAGRSELDRRDR